MASLGNSEEPVRLLNLEEELAGPEGEAAMRRCDEQLLALDFRRKEAMDRGLATDDFKRCELLGEAVTLARKILRLARRRT